MDWSRWPNFRPDEFRCKHTGLDGVKPDLLDVLQTLRNRLNTPMIITSGYRHPTHPVEARKERPGEHSEGLAADVVVSVDRRYDLVRYAIQAGIARIGVADSFIHLGVSRNFPHPRIWTY